jgi:hypothetical protein
MQQVSQTADLHLQQINRAVNELPADMPVDTPAPALKDSAVKNG